MRLGKSSKGAAVVTANIATDAQKYGVVKETDVVRQKYLETKRVLKSKMEQEQRNSRANSLKIQTLWRKIMRINKVDGLRKEIEVIEEKHVTMSKGDEIREGLWARIIATIEGTALDKAIEVDKAFQGDGIAAWYRMRKRYTKLSQD